MNLRKLRNRTFAVALTVLAMTGVGVPSAQAGDFSPITIEQMVDASTYVIRGTVTNVWVEQDDDGRIWTRATVQVKESVKGKAPAELTLDTMGGTMGDVRTSIWGMSRFSVNEDVLVFVEKLDNGRWASYGMFQGKYTIRRAARDTRLHAMRWHGHPDVPFDHRFLPYPAPEKRIYLDDFMERIEARVKAGWDGMPIDGVSMEKLRSLNVNRNGGLQ